MSYAFQTNARRWHVVADFMKEQQFKTLVEVGCKEGKLAGHVLKELPYAKVIAIDPWLAQPDNAAVEDRETYEDWDFVEIEKTFWSNVEGHHGRLEFMRMTSLEAAKQLEGQQFDAVFIDALHDQESVQADIRAWWPLIRDEGFLMGHDYQHKFPGVIRAVAASFPLMRVGLLPDSVWMVMKAPDIVL